MQIKACFTQVYCRLHGLFVDVSKNWVGCFTMLLVLSLKVFKLVCHFLLEACQIVRLQSTVIIMLLNVHYDLNKRSFAIPVISVTRIRNFISSTINLDFVFWYSLENHCSEHALVKSCTINFELLDSEVANSIFVTYS